MLSDGRECSPPPRLIESAGLRPRLFQPQLIECICTRLHNDRWVSPQLASFFFFFMFSKNDKASLCFLTPLSVCFSLSAFLALLFPPKIREGKKKKRNNLNVCQQSRDAFIPRRRRRRRRRRIHLADGAQFVTFSCSPATSFSGALSDDTRQQQSERSCTSH